MKYLINRYFSDLKKYYVLRDGKRIPLSSLTIREFFNYVRNIPYRKDISPIEVVSRPKHILRNSFMGMDCKKKGILISSYLRSNRVPYRLIASSKKPSGKIHHVFPQGFFNGKWKNVDATYPHYKLFAHKKVTKATVL